MQQAEPAFWQQSLPTLQQACARLATLPLVFLLQHSCAGEQHFSFLSQQLCTFAVVPCGFTVRETFCVVRVSVRFALSAFTCA